MEPIWKQCKPCPFCGTPAEAASSEDEEERVFWFIECRKCSATMDHYGGANYLVSAWNQRAKI